MATIAKDIEKLSCMDIKNGEKILDLWEGYLKNIQKLRIAHASNNNFSLGIYMLMSSLFPLLLKKEVNDIYVIKYFKTIEELFKNTNITENRMLVILLGYTMLAYCMAIKRKFL